MPLHIFDTTIPEVKLLTPEKLSDHRGFFSEVYNRTALVELGIDLDFVQDNHSLSVEVGTIRGLHFQSPPAAQGKLVRVVRGRILDVAVDIRRSSATFGRHVAIELSADNWRQLLVPVGFAHGFCTLEPNTEVVYKVSHEYARDHDRGIAWNDSSIGICWPLNGRNPIVSERDRSHPGLAASPHLFA